MFQSTHPQRMRLAARATNDNGQGFNPRIRKGCDFTASKTLPDLLVSIHASAKDATYWGWLFLFVQKCFNPRIRKGCDSRATSKRSATNSFNPRIRKGCDIKQWPVSFSITGFNPRIRKGCDQFTMKRIHEVSCFNPRIRKGCDYIKRGSLPIYLGFQSTHPQRMRQKFSPK